MGPVIHPKRNSGYLPLLDVLRILASLSVVHHHMRDSLIFGVGVGLPLFLVIFFALASISTKREPMAQTLVRKGSDLLIPWVRWSIIYVAILVLSDSARGLDPMLRLSPAMLLIGGHDALWFLPFAAAALLPAEILRRCAQKLSPVQGVLLLVTLGVIMTVLATTLLQSNPPSPFANWFRALPAIPWGLAVGLACRDSAKTNRRALLVAIAIGALATFALNPNQAHPNDLARRMALAVLLVCLAFSWKPALPTVLRPTANLAFGIYLVHPLVGKVLVEAMDVFVWSPAVHGNVTWLLSLASIYVVRQAGLKWRELRPASAGPTNWKPSTFTPPARGYRVRPPTVNN